MSASKEYSASVLWRNLQPQTTGLDYCALWHDEQGWTLEGIVVQTFAGTPGRASYWVQCDTDWQTRSVFTEVEIGATRRTLSLSAIEGHWYIGSEEQTAVQNCLDVDLGVTPATNTLPIRRLRLAVGASHEVVATLVRFPDLHIQPLYQRYIRLDETHYRYESFHDSNMQVEPAFTAELTVAADGLVQTYTGGWERLQDKQS